MRKLYLFLIPLSFCFLFFRSRKNNDNVLRLHFKNTFTTDPATSRDCSSSTIIKLTFEGLCRISANKKAELAMASDFHVSENNTTYTFYLKPSKWSDGSKVTSFDFLHSWKMVLDPCFPCFNIGLMFCLKNARDIKKGVLNPNNLGVTCPNDHTICIELEKPMPTEIFLELLSFDVFMPSGKWEKGNRSNFYNGAFVIDQEYRKNKNLVLLNKNPYYRDKHLIKLDHIEVNIIEDENTALAMFENGLLDWVGAPFCRIPTEYFTFNEQAEKVCYQDVFMSYWIIFNTLDDVFCDKEFRESFGSLINKFEICNTLKLGRVPANSLYPESKNVQKCNFYKLPSNLQLMVNRDHQNSKIVQIIKEQIKEKSDCDVSIKIVGDWGSYISRLTNGNFQLARYGWRQTINSPLNILEAFYYDEFNFSKWKNKDFISLIEKAQNECDLQKRNEICQEAEKVLLDEYCVIPIFFEPLVALKNKKLKNITISAGGIEDFSKSYKIADK